MPAGSDLDPRRRLGRGVVVLSGAEAPPAWTADPRIVIDDAAVRDPATVVARLHESWRSRSPVVVDLHVDPGTFRTPETWTQAPWEFDSGFTPWTDRLHFLVWNNNYDARSGSPIWWWARKAARIGAEEADGTTGDVVSSNGDPAWVDGGPVDDIDPASIAPARLIRAEAIEAGHLSAVPAWTDPRAELAADQLEAVAHRGGPARIIAPAGSGKTRVLTERLRHLLVDRGHDPGGVVAVAYNRKAQEEMADRLPEVGARIRTLNALGYGLVTRYLGQRPRLLDEREVRRRLEPLLPRLNRRLNTDPMAPYLEGLSIVRLGLVDPDDAETRADAPGLADAVEPYRAGLRRDGVLDFDEQIVRAIETLLADGGFRRAEQARHRHLLVDEFQDLTPAHVLLIRLLAAPTYDVFGVGDDDQVIYGHAGASPRFLVDFTELFPGAAEHALETNYRCPPAIVDAARHVLAYNRDRVDKQIRAARTDDDPGALQVRTVPSADIGKVLVEEVRAAIAATGDPARVAVLTRTNSALLTPHVALGEHEVPMRSTLRADVLDRVGMRAALAWLRIANDPGSVASRDLSEVRRRPSRGFPSWIDKWLGRCTSAHDVGRAADRMDDDRVADKLRDLADDMEHLGEVARAGATTRALLTAIRDEVGLGSAMELLDGRPGAAASSHLDDLDALLQVADLQPDPEAFEDWLRHRLRDAGGGDGDHHGVTLSTVHRVKGREWPAVIVHGADEGLLPHRLADDVEEERRVFHVALTRGIERVTIVADAGRPSPFLAELDGSAPRDHTTRRPGRTTARQASAKPATNQGDVLEGEHHALFEALRAWRGELARARGGPAFTILNDATMREIARTRPDSLRALSRVKGIGPTKLDDFGDDVLEIVGRFA